MLWLVKGSRQQLRTDSRPHKPVAFEVRSLKELQHVRVLICTNASAGSWREGQYRVPKTASTPAGMSQVVA